ncbi:MAG: SAM-dependent DNA methyltransferase [Eggerthella sp.]|nr:SAM-dependent DNA methyltransferase [Eggerthella sp.]
MAVSSLVKKIQNIMREDAGVNGNAQRIEQMVWMFFLKIYDAKEEEWELVQENYESIIPDNLKWRNWAVDNADGNALTGTALLSFVNNELFPTLSELPITSQTTNGQAIVRYAFESAHNYMQDGILLRRVINEINDSVDFTEYKELHAFAEIYETILKDLQAAGQAGEFYTPRAVTDFMAQMLQPTLGESIADFACGTGGFLTSALKILDGQVKTPHDRELYSASVYGLEKKQLPYLLCVTNMFLHDIDNPRVFHTNSLDKDIREYRNQAKDGLFDVVLMNPPYGGSEQDVIKANFPIALRSSETADLFMGLIMYRLKTDGRAAVILPDGFLFGSDGAKLELKRKLLDEFNLHTIIRLPGSVFAPYTSITTNILFFDNGRSTEGTWFYRMDMPDGYKHFNKTKPIQLSHFNPIIEWWNDRKEIIVDGSPKAKYFTQEDLKDLQLNFDQCGFPHEEIEILPPDELIKEYRAKRQTLDLEIDMKLNQICEILGIEA